ncbi:MAG: tripartite tricarboxylate transporter substrate binding protein [Burkholderiales bacterium]|nr:tripartite tricarboxylate transporter substrate binding protein [Burkholderiales bacterium]
MKQAIAKLSRLGIGALCACFAAAAAAQDYPSRPIRMILPNTPGGITDIAARLVGPYLSKQLGQPVVMENRVAAGGVVAANTVAQAAPDGYTLITVFDSFATNPYLYQGVQYDALKDFSPISLVIKGPQLLVVYPGSGIRHLQELLQVAKAKGGAFNFATAGAGTSSRLTLELIKSAAGIEPLGIHYKGGAPAITAVLSGEVTAMVTAMNIAIHHVRSGKLLALAVTSPRRLAMLPDVPPLAEALPGFESQTWVGMLAPAATPRPIVERLNADLHKVLALPEVRGVFEKQGSAVSPTTPEEFHEWLRTQTALWSRVIRERKITLD